MKWRRATPDDAAALTELERVANLAALGHVFPPDRYPFPESDVLARWVLVLDDAEVHVDVVDGPGGLLACSAYDDRSLRHLAVHPERWGEGLGGAAVERAERHVRARGAVPTLWCLVENHRARRLYERCGWRATEVTREAVWSPHPVEVQYAAPPIG